MNNKTQPNNNQNPNRHANNNNNPHRNKRPHHHNNNNNSPSNNGEHNNKRRFHRPYHNRPKHHNNNNNSNNPNQNKGPQVSIERLYEKYLNLLDQHLIARRKYYDMYFRADDNQKIKLEKNFYNTLNEVRDFESKMAPDIAVMFEKRVNGLKPDTTYSLNHQIQPESENLLNISEISDPHFLESQKNLNYKNDTEESIGNLDDYLKYKNI